MNGNYLTPKEFAEAAGVSVQTIYKQMNSRLSPYVETIKGKKKIAAAALKEFYDIEEQSETTETDEIKPETTVNKPETTVKVERTTDIKPETTFENQSVSTENQPKTDLEKRIEELENLLHRQIEEDRQEKEFLRDQIRQKDKTIENLTENLKMAQQLAAADKKKLLEIEQRQQDREPIEADQAEEVITPAAAAADQEQGQDDNQQEKEQPQERGLKAFLRRLFG